MKALIVYDSAYGNTERIAKAVGDALSGDVRVARAGEVDASGLASLDLLIVGSPTQGFRPTKPVQALIASIPADALKGVAVAAFDTRIPAAQAGIGLRLIMRVGGYAAPHITQALEKKGGKLAVPPEGFSVKDKEGPLLEGELERAADWAKGIAVAQANLPARTG
jgi:flavodoxin I